MIYKEKYHHLVTQKKESLRSTSNPKISSDNLGLKNDRLSAYNSIKRKSVIVYSQNPRSPVKLTPISNALSNVSNTSSTPSSLNFPKLPNPSQRFLNPSITKVLKKYQFLLLPKFTGPGTQQISIKKASKNKQWLLKTRSFLTKEISSIINSSNGISVSAQISTYKYYLGKGNNSKLIKKIMSTRWWWTCVQEDQLPNVNMVWSQSIDNEYISTIPVIYYKPKLIDSVSRSVQSFVTYQTETLSNVYVDLSSLKYDLITSSSAFISYTDLKPQNPSFFRTHNKLQYHFYLSDKKYLYNIMKKYYGLMGQNVFDYLPITFYVKNIDSDDFKLFLTDYQMGVVNNTQNAWILKPGENSNRGNGIVITDNIKEIRDYIESNSSFHTIVVQKYIENPFLINKRKFDIRLYVLITSVNGVLQCYFYNEGYLRTASKEFSLKTLDNKYIHLTNDAIQQHCDEYGKFENGNKLSYSDFQRYLDSHNLNINFCGDVLPRIKTVVKDTINASFSKLDSKRGFHTFEILGYDFLLDSNLKPWLLEVNTNPCLELSSSILSRLIPAMLENVLKIAIDPVFPEPLNAPKKISGSLPYDILNENKFELIFHEEHDGKRVMDYLNNQNKLDIFLSDLDLK